MSLRETLENFAGSLGCAATNAPDEYADWSYITYELNMADLKELWASIRPQLKRDLEQAEWVDGKLREMFTAFDAGEKEQGRKAAWALYNADVTKLR
ncbi:MAG: hypothetical protein ACT4NV_07250 [Rhodoferax sp.]